jgi:thioredoxin reductase (NADPH)
MEKLIIIGSGPAGLTAAIYAARANLNPLVIEGSKPGGQLVTTSLVENWPGEQSIMGPQLMIKMRAQAEHLGARFESGNVNAVNLSKQPFFIETDSKKQFAAQSIILATGATPKKLGVPGEEAYWAKGVSVCALCDGAFFKDRKVVIIGGGDTAMEDAQFLSRLTDDITIIHIGPQLTASYAMQQPVLANKKIRIIYSAATQEFLGNGNNLTGIRIKKVDGTEETVPADGVFLAIGLKPNTAFLKGHIALSAHGYLELTDTTKTSIKGIFGAGDIADYRYRQAITAAGAGCMAALDAERYLATMI